MSLGLALTLAAVLGLLPSPIVSGAHVPRGTERPPTWSVPEATDARWSRLFPTPEPPGVAAAQEAPAPTTPAEPSLAVLTRNELSSVLAAVALAGGEASVVADTTITRDLPDGALRCARPGWPRPERCPIDVIEPQTPGTGLLSVVATDTVMESLAQDASPIEGPLGFRIDGRQLELLGVVRADGSVPEGDRESAGRWRDPSDGAGPPTVTATKRGLLFELWLGGSAIATGERLTALTRISNVGTRSPWWETNVCGAGPALTAITPPRPGNTGLTWSGKAATFKQKLLENKWRPEILVDIDTIDIENYGCNAYSAIERFPPGSVAQAVVAWDAVDREGRPIIPGPATLTSTFGMWVGGRRPDTAEPSIELTVESTVEITGEPGTTTPVSRYADAALSDEAFRSWVERQRRPGTWDASTIYWPNDDGDYPKGARYERATEGAVDVSMFVGNGRRGRATVDTATLEVLGRSLPGGGDRGDTP